jgi:Cupin domain
MGEHRHRALVERFTVLEGELTLKLAGQTTVLPVGKTAVIEPGVWHGWWNASQNAPGFALSGERFAHMIETAYGLGRLGHTNSKGMPHPLQLALFAQEFSDVIEFRSPPPTVQRTLFAALALIARWRGYRATYPQLSRTVLAPRTSQLHCRLPMPSSLISEEARSAPLSLERSLVAAAITSKAQCAQGSPRQTQAPAGDELGSRAGR